MAQPTAYQPAHEFVNDEGLNPNFPGTELDVEFNAIDATLTEVLANLALIQRDDGALKNASVGLDQLTDALKAIIGDEDTIETLVDAIEGLDANVAAAAASAAAALVSQTAAATQASNASTSASTAATQASSASTSASTAAASAAAALVSQTAAASSASSASTSASNAATQASNASTSASNAASSASSASTSASNAATAETNAEAAQAAAEAAQAAVEAAYDSFDDRYLGAKAADPTLDNDGNALAEGALVWNSTENALKVYDGAAWQVYNPLAGIGGSVGSTNNALVRADGTGGNTLKGSPVTIDDSGVVAGAVNLLRFDAAQSLSASEKAQGRANVDAAGIDQDLAGYIVGTRTVATAETIPAVILAVRTTGYAAAGDGGGAYYKRVGAQPSHDGWWQDAAGAYFELKEKVVRPEMFGADDTGASDAKAAIQSAVDYQNARGGGTVHCVGSYRLDSTVTPKAKVRILSDPGTEFVVTGNFPAFFALGSRITGEGNTLASNASTGATAVTLSAGKGANFAAGQWVLVLSEAVIHAATPQKSGQLARIESISTDTLTLDRPLNYTFNTANSAQVQRLTTVDDVVIDGGVVRSTNGSTSTTSLVVFAYCLRPVIRNVICKDNYAYGVQFFGCMGHRAENVRGENLYSSDALNYYGYAIVENGANLGGMFLGIVGERVRHVYTTNQSVTLLPYGEPVGTIVSGHGISTRAAAFDTHAEGCAISFVGCTVIGSMRAAFQIRARQTNIVGGNVKGCVGAAVWLVNSASAVADDCTVRGLVSDQTNSGTDDNGVDWEEQAAIRDNGKRNVVEGNTILRCGGPAIEMEGTNAEDPDYRGNKIYDPCQTTTTKKFGIGTAQNRATTLRIDDNHIVATHTNMDNGINVAGSSVHLMETDNRVSGNQSTAVASSNTHYSNRSPARGVMASLGPQVAATVAGGVITLPATSRGYGGLLITGEGGAADDVDTISTTGVAEGALLEVKRASSHNITLKHATGNILNGTAADITLSSSLHRVLLKKETTNGWLVISKNF